MFYLFVLQSIAAIIGAVGAVIMVHGGDDVFVIINIIVIVVIVIILFLRFEVSRSPAPTQC